MSGVKRCHAQSVLGWVTPDDLLNLLCQKALLVSRSGDPRILVGIICISLGQCCCREISLLVKTKSFCRAFPVSPLSRVASAVAWSAVFSVSGATRPAVIAGEKFEKIRNVVHLSCQLRAISCCACPRRPAATPTRQPSAG
jgi:hypothetical protein